MAELLVVTSKVKDAVSGADCNCGGDFPEALSKKVSSLVAEAARRAKANGRKTVRADDL